jgi:hypothetical protein
VPATTVCVVSIVVVPPADLNRAVRPLAWERLTRASVLPSSLAASASCFCAETMGKLKGAARVFASNAHSPKELSRPPSNEEGGDHVQVIDSV